MLHMQIQSSSFGRHRKYVCVGEIIPYASVFIVWPHVCWSLVINLINNRGDWEEKAKSLTVFIWWYLIKTENTSMLWDTRPEFILCLNFFLPLSFCSFYQRENFSIACVSDCADHSEWIWVFFFGSICAWNGECGQREEMSWESVHTMWRSSASWKGSAPVR